MFKGWRSEKNRIKAVFKLQFRATQIPQSGWDTLVVALVPLDVGKPTVKSEKAAVAAADGSCRWENPIYETVKFVQEAKTGRINEKIYQFLVSATGSPKAELLGEATIDFADYAETIQPSSVSLPLKASNSSVILHITVERMQEDADERENEENGAAMVKSQRRTLKSQLSNCDKEDDNKIPSGNNDSISAEDNSLINGQVRSKFPSTRVMVLHAESNGKFKKSSRSSDAVSVSGSDSSSGRHTPREYVLKNSNAHQDSASSLLPLCNSDAPQNPTTNAPDLVTDYGDHRRTNKEWSVSSVPDGSIDSSTNGSEDTGLRERSQTEDASLDELRNDVVVLARQVDVLEMELQSLRKQVAKERSRGEDLSRELCSLKAERDALKRECEQLKASPKISNTSQFDGEDLRSILEEIKQELNHEKNLNANLRLQLQKTQESNSELILAVRDLDEMLEQKNREIACINCNQMGGKPATNEESQGKKCGNGFSHLQHFESNRQFYETFSEHEDEEQYALEVLVKEHDNSKVGFSFEQNIADLNGEIELYRKDREELEMQMEQLALDYEILKQENHDISSKLGQTQLREQLRMQYECSAHLSIINDLEAHVESLEKVLESQAEAFESDLAFLTHAKVEQEQKAIRLEEALRKTRWKNINTAEQIQEELKSLSIQLSSTFSENEKLAMRALTEASELRLQNRELQELLDKAKEELGSVQDHCRVKLQELSNELDMRKEQMDELVFKLKDKSEELVNQKKYEEVRHRAFSEEMLELKTELELLEREKSDIYEQLKQKDDLRAQVEQLKTATEETEMLLQDRNMERDVLQREVSTAREEAKKLLDQLHDLRHLEDEKESAIRTLNSELAILREQYNDLKHSLFEDELEKENLRKQVFHLRGDLRKKEDAITSIERRLRDGNARAVPSDGTEKTTIKNKSNRSGPAPRGSKEVAKLHEKIKFLEAEIKLKNAELEGSKHSFLKEKGPCNRIGEIEKGIGELGQNNPDFYEDNFHKEGKDVKQSNTESSSKVEEESLTGNTCDQSKQAEVLLSETTLLREKNESMKAELKEMQERYSEISLKFAEVEGERQQLVMTIRTLKNALKN